MKSKILFWIIAGLVVMQLASCGTRKTQKSEVTSQLEVSDNSEKTENSGSSKTTETETKKTEVAEETTTEENETLTPVDPEKPIIKVGPDGKTTTYYNAAVSTGKKTTTGKKATIEESKAKEQEKDTVARADKNNIAVKESISTKEKGTEREDAFSGIWLIIGMAMGTVIVIWFLVFLYRKYKNEQKK